MLGLCLVAAFAVGAIAATSAFALPEWGKCEAKAGGKYSDSNCTKKAKTGTGTFEFKKGKELAPVKFTGGNVGSGGVLISTLEQCAPFKRIPRSKCEFGEEGIEKLEAAVECESERNTGETFGTNQIRNISVKFHGCKILGSVPCSNGPEQGEILVNALKGSLGYINKAEKKVGVLLEPAIKHGEFAKFTCAGEEGAGGLAIVVGVGNEKEGAFYKPEKTGGYDGIISPITPVNTMTTKFTQVYTVNPATHENIPSKFEGKHVDLLESYVFSAEEPGVSALWAAAGEEITNENTEAEEGEIKA
jgi:hypothetical protein